MTLEPSLWTLAPSPLQFVLEAHCSFDLQFCRKLIRNKSLAAVCRNSPGVHPVDSCSTCWPREKLSLAHNSPDLFAWGFLTWQPFFLSVLNYSLFDRSWDCLLASCQPCRELISVWHNLGWSRWKCRNLGHFSAHLYSFWYPGYPWLFLSPKIWVPTLAHTSNSPALSHLLQWIVTREHWIKPHNRAFRSTFQTE